MSSAAHHHRHDNVYSLPVQAEADPSVYALQELALKILRAIYLIMAIGEIFVGVAILIGGTDRFPYPSYQPMLDLSNGSVVPWGMVVIIAGVLMLVPHRFAQLVGLAVAFLWFNLFCVMFVVADIQYEHSSSTAPVPYAILALISVALMTLKVAECRMAHRHKASQWTRRS